MAAEARKPLKLLAMMDLCVSSCVASGLLTSNQMRVRFASTWLTRDQPPALRRRVRNLVAPQLIYTGIQMVWEQPVTAKQADPMIHIATAMTVFLGQSHRSLECQAAVCPADSRLLCLTGVKPTVAGLTGGHSVGACGCPGRPAASGARDLGRDGLS